jgi:hypothetical protein
MLYIVEFGFFPMSNFSLSALVDRIYTAEQELLKYQDGVAVVVDQLAFLDAEIEVAIASNAELKNDQQRKAAKLEAQRDNYYVELKNSLIRAKKKVATAEIEVNYWRNLFSAKKLEARLEVYRLESVA